MTMQLQVICDSCGTKLTSEKWPKLLKPIEYEGTNQREKHLCNHCFQVVNSLLYRATTPEDEYGACSTEKIQKAISAMAERRKQVDERGEVKSNG